jgi:hypothetical protein
MTKAIKLQLVQAMWQVLAVAGLVFALGQVLAH